MKQLSLCIPTWNRTDLLLKSFANVIADERIGEVIICDDSSDPIITIWINEVLEQFKSEFPKVKLFIHEDRLGVYGNKHRAVSYAENEFVIIFDSDNIIDTDYIDCIYKRVWDKAVIFAPDFAKPTFDYTAFGGKLINRKNVNEFIGKKGFDCLLNTMNYFVSKDEYMRVWENKDVDASDSIWMNFLWLSKGNSIFVVPGMQYFHLVHEQSNYKQASRASQQDCQRIGLMIKNLR